MRAGTHEALVEPAGAASAKDAGAAARNTTATARLRRRKDIACPLHAKGTDAVRFCRCRLRVTQPLLRPWPLPHGGGVCMRPHSLPFNKT